MRPPPSLKKIKISLKEGRYFLKNQIYFEENPDADF